MKLKVKTKQSMAVCVKKQRQKCTQPEEILPRLICAPAHRLCREKIRLSPKNLERKLKSSNQGSE